MASPAAYKAAATGELNIWLVILFATLGAVIGALINYLLALWLGKPIVYKFANSRFGHMCLIDQQKVETAEQFFIKYGVAATLVGRLVPAVRQLISIPAGIARMGLARFVFFTTLGAGVWNTILAVLGYYMASIPGLQTEEAVMNKVKEYSGAIGLVFIALAVLIVGILVYKAFSKGKKAE
jgi:membrane protein DedA with SNARE-associated domain